MNTTSTLFTATRKGITLFTFAAALAGITVGAQAGPHRKAAPCENCGTVVSSKTYERAAESGSGVGAVTGALVGGLLGNKVGGGNGRALATAAGAVGGGFAGNALEKNIRKDTFTDVQVQMSNGNVRQFTESGPAHWKKGAQVRVQEDKLVAER
jgi:outer membrane lipoprotein SlyB